MTILIATIILTWGIAVGLLAGWSFGISDGRLAEREAHARAERERLAAADNERLRGLARKLGNRPTSYRSGR